MKQDMKKYLLYTVCGMMSLGALTLTSCKADEPEAIPAEELYLRAFIKKYGLIDPEQDWNQAERATVTVTVGQVQTLNVYVSIANYMYLVAAYKDVSGTVAIPIDVPEGVSELYVEADDAYLPVRINGSVDFTEPQRRPQRKPSVAALVDWDTATTKNGETGGDFSNSEGKGQPRATVEIPTSSYIDIPTCAWPGPHEGRNERYQVKWGYSGDHTSFYQTTKNANVHFRLHNSSVAGYQITMKTQTQVGGFQLSAVLIAEDGGTIVLDDMQEITRLEGNREGHGVVNNLFCNDHTFFIPPIPAGYYQLILTAVGDDLADNLQAGEWGKIQIKKVSVDEMAWLLVAEDLGATDDFDFNDVIIRVTAITTNKASLDLENQYWQTIHDGDQHLVLHAPAEGASRANEPYTQLKVDAMSAGGILDSYLHFRMPSNGGADYKDFVLTPGTDVKDLETATDCDTKNTRYYNSANTEKMEWHYWFLSDGTSEALIGTKNNRPMINTGLTSMTGQTAKIVVPGTFSLTKYSVIYKDYDQTNPNIGDTNGGGTINSDSFTGTDFNNNNDRYLAWTYGADAGYNIQGFYITVGEYSAAACDRIIGGPQKGAAPQMFLIPDVGALGRWRWPYERVPVTSVYPRFKEWVVSHANPQASSWYTAMPPETSFTHENEESAAVYPRQD